MIARAVTNAPVVMLVAVLVIAASPARALDVGAAAPAWELTGADGASWTSAGLRGNVVVLEFWATWCPKCQTNMPEVARLTQDYVGQPVQVIAVNINENGDPVAYMQATGGTIPFALNGDAVARQFGVAGTPTVVVIDSEGRLALRIPGAGAGRTEQLRSTVDGLLAATRSR